MIRALKRMDPMVGSGGVSPTGGMISDTSDNAELLDFCFLCSRQFFHDSLNYDQVDIFREEEILEKFFEELGPVDRSLLHCCRACKALCKTLLRTKEALSSLIDEITGLLLRSRKVSFLLSKSRVVSCLFQSLNSSLPPCETSSSYLPHPLSHINFSAKDVVPSTPNNDCFPSHFDFPSDLSVSDSIDLGLSHSTTTSVIKKSPLSALKSLKTEKMIEKTIPEIASSMKTAFSSITNDSIMNSVSDNACDISDVRVPQKKETSVIVSSHTSQNPPKRNPLSKPNLTLKSAVMEAKTMAPLQEHSLIKPEIIIETEANFNLESDNNVVVSVVEDIQDGEYILIVPEYVIDISQRSIKKENSSSAISNSENKSDRDVVRPSISTSSSQCNFCGKSFKNSRNLRNHIGMHRQERKFVCEICGASYRHKAGLVAHVAIHNGESKFQCQICLKTFTQKAGLQRHLNLHNKKTQFQCDACGKEFIHHSSLSAHKLTHGGVRKYECHICDKNFTHNSHLSRHLKVHATGEKRHKCDVCDRSFTEKYNLQVHMKIHDGDRADLHKCSECSKTFTRKFKLKIHKNKIHNNIVR